MGEISLGGSLLSCCQGDSDKSVSSTHEPVLELAILLKCFDKVTLKCRMIVSIIHSELSFSQRAHLCVPELVCRYQLSGN